ncbi:hypothetical protein L218DRAFT_97437 [Marasmius fiardii PR-910]|nr:hypothetical protein L218DRAFT_97437 [Marasmius fiardii PR-910]
MSNSDVFLALHTIYGSFYIVTYICAILYGFACLQTWWYFRSYASRDDRVVRSMVAVVIVCETLQMALMSTSMYRFCISGMPNNDDSATGIDIPVEKPFMIQFIFSGAIAVIVQMFYCLRIYKISRSKTVPLVVASIGWASCAILYALSITTLVECKTFAEFLAPNRKMMSTLMNATAALCDISISGVIVYYLHRRKSGIRNSTSIINRMILFTASTGILTSMIALVSLICQFVLPASFFSVWIYLFCGRLYTNSFLTTLNGRLYIIEGSITPRIGFRVPRRKKQRVVPRKVMSTPMVTMVIEDSAEVEKVRSILKPRIALIMYLRYPAGGSL